MEIRSSSAILRWNFKQWGKARKRRQQTFEWTIELDPSLQRAWKGRPFTIRPTAVAFISCQRLYLPLAEPPVIAGHNLRGTA